MHKSFRFVYAVILTGYGYIRRFGFDSPECKIQSGDVYKRQVNISVYLGGTEHTAFWYFYPSVPSSVNVLWIVSVNSNCDWE